MPKQQQIYFPNLNGLRFIAASLVIIHHTEQFKSIFKLPNYYDSVPFFQAIGLHGVNLFFVLSGFLITYLLLSEEKSYNLIDIKNFYIRRLLRIWPLYFLIILLAFFIIPQFNLFLLPHLNLANNSTNFYLKIFLFSLFLPNFAQALLGQVPFASHTWSIGTEEQFYLMWPLFLKYIKKWRAQFMLLLIAIYIFLNYFLSTQLAHLIPFRSVLQGYLLSFNISCLAIGALLAFYMIQQHQMITILSNKAVFYIALILVLIMLWSGCSLSFIQNEIYAALFGIMILNFVNNKHFDNTLQNKIFNYLGKISYGLYMFHPIVIIICLKLCIAIKLLNSWIIYPLVFIVTIMMAAISYRFFESFFLQFKSKFSKIESGDELK